MERFKKSFIISKKDSNRKLPSLNAEVVEPIYHKDPAISLRLTVLDILEKNRGKDVIIYEDDVLLTEHFDIERLKEIADKYRDKIDYINTGVILQHEDSSFVKPFYNEPNLRRVNYYQGSQCVYYLPSALEKLKASYQTDIDRMLHLRTVGVVTYPFMTYQKDSEEAIHYKEQEERFKKSEKDKRWM